MKRFAILLFALVVSATCINQVFAQTTPRLNHIAFYVLDLKVSTNFYRNIVGLDTIPEPFHDGKHTWLAIGPGASLHVIEGSKAKIEHFKNNHICFSVPSVEKFVEILSKNNLTYEDLGGKKNTITNRVDGVKQIWLQDPDGYWIEINDAKD